ncbi:MAG: hypothetical protein RDU14_04780 [Melioribacteraceae bacterium]|nr:hypothetical protein [Melioribacteraceae bacterium]
MLGLWLALSGLFFGTLCSYIAKKYDRFPKNWFLVGFISGPLGLLLIILLSKLNEDELSIEESIRTMLGAN